MNKNKSFAEIIGFDLFFPSNIFLVIKLNDFFFYWNYNLTLIFFSFLPLFGLLKCSHAVFIYLVMKFLVKYDLKSQSFSKKGLGFMNLI